MPLVMRQSHAGGEKLFLDYAGDTVPVVVERRAGDTSPSVSLTNPRRFRVIRQGEIRDRTSEGHHHRIAGRNLLAAIPIYWNTLHLGKAVDSRRRDGLDVSPELLAHISLPGWAHILLTGEYRWPKGAEPV